MGFHDKEYFYHLALKENFVFNYLFYIMLVTFLFIFLILYYSHKIFSILFIYLKYAFYSLRSADSGIIILNSKGQIIYLNSRVQKYLNLSEQLKKKMYFEKALIQRENIVECIRKSWSTCKCSINNRQI